MADLSLDDYIQRKGPKFSGRLGNRLGNKTQGPKKTAFKGGPKKANTQFTVTGVGSVKQRLGQTRVGDARQKIMQKTKFVDARSRIELKKTQSQAVDVRSKINNAKAKKLDARQLLKAKQQRQQTPLQQQARPLPGGGGAGPRFMVTGLGKVALKGGPEVHNIPTIQSSHTGIIKTIHSSQPISASSISASAVAGNIVKTISNENSGYSSQMMKGLRITKTMKPTKPKVAPPPETYYDEEEDEEDLEYDSGMMRSAPTRYSPPRPTRVNKPVSAPARKPASQQVSSADVVSPVQGYRIIISNLHSIVSQEDIVELFGAIGDMKKARLVKPGTAEVIYKEKSDAQMAVKKYHQRELDGQPMSVMLSSVTPKPAKAVKPTPPAPAASRVSSSPPPSGPLRLGKHSSSDKSDPNVDTSLIHRALFKTSAKEEPSRPVTFTVKI